MSEVSEEQPDLFEIIDLGHDIEPKPDSFDHKHLQKLFHVRIANSKAAGKDGTRVAKFAEGLVGECQLIEARVKSGTYRFTPFKERLILRGPSREPRQISIPTVRDRLTLRSLCEVLHAEAPLSAGHSPHSLVHKVVNAIREPGPARSFVRIDVKNFFPSVVHSQLEKELQAAKLDPFVVKLCMQAVSTPTGASKESSTRGIPQGLSISNALSAIYLQRFDASQNKYFAQYFRYVDDILIITDSMDAQSTLKRISKSLNRKGLSAHKVGTEGKTEIRAIEDGIDFLGYHICIEKVSVRDSSYKRMFKNCMKLITDFRYRKNIEKFIFRLNLKITGCIINGNRRGWAMFFAQTEDISQLAFLDVFIEKQIRRVGLPKHFFSQIKKFVKSHYEIRFNLEDSSYIPNFDAYDTVEMINVISVLTGDDLAVLGTWSTEAIIEKFQALLASEVQDLEQDVGSPS